MRYLGVGCQKIHHAQKRRANGGRHGSTRGAPVSVPTMQTFGPAFLTDCAERWKPKTRTTHAHNMQRFILPAFGNRRVDAITARDVRSWFDELSITRVATANRSLAVLSSLMKHAEDLGLRPEGSNPCRGLRRRKTGFKAHYLTDVEFAALGWALAKVRGEYPVAVAVVFSQAEVWGWRQDGSNPCRHVKRYREHQRERFLSEEEIARLGEVLREAEEEMPSTVAAFRLLLTGCRMSEIRDLRWEYVKEDCIELPDAKTGGRVVPLGPEARAVLSAIPRDDDNLWVITGKLPGSHLTDLQRPWRRIRKRARLEDVRIHDLRHSFASRALALGESLTMIGKLIGHTQIQTTARYAQLARDSFQNAAARIIGSISGNLSSVHGVDNTTKQ